MLWKDGLARFCRLTGKPERSARALLARLLRDGGDDCAMVSDVLRDAERDRPGDPVAWIAASIATRTGRRAGTGPPSRLGYLMDASASLTPSFDLDGTAEEIPCTTL